MSSTNSATEYTLTIKQLDISNSWPNLGVQQTILDLASFGIASYSNFSGDQAQLFL